MFNKYWLVNELAQWRNSYIFFSCSLRYHLGRAIAQAVSRWLPTAAARVRSRVWSSGICGLFFDPEDGGYILLRNTEFPPNYRAVTTQRVYALLNVNLLRVMILLQS
jgi:hypothetical protein